MHTVFALLCFVVVIHWLIFPYPSCLLHWHCGNLTIAPVPAKQPWWIWINTSCEFIMNDCITTTKRSTTKPCAYFLGYTVLKPYNAGANHYFQEPVVFSVTIRENLDPYGQYTESEIWESLENSHLKDYISESGEGLDLECGEDGSNMRWCILHNVMTSRGTNK